MFNISQVLLVVLLPATAICSGGKPFEATISRAMQESKVQKRDLFLYFTAPDCGRCATLDSYFEQPDVQRQLAARYISARVDMAAFDGKACSEIYDVSKVPALVVVSSDGKIKYKSQGSLAVEDIDGLLGGDFSLSTPRNNTGGPGGKSSDMRRTTPDAILSDGKYSVQIGFFSNEANASQMVALAREKGFDQALMQPEQRDDKVFYRVLVGSYPTEKQAQLHKSRMETAGLTAKVHVLTP